MVDKSEKVVWMARLGFVARGIGYALLGYLALSSAESQTVKQGQSGALEYLNSIPGGTAILFLAAALRILLATAARPVRTLTGAGTSSLTSLWTDAPLGTSNLWNVLREAFFGVDP